MAIVEDQLAEAEKLIVHLQAKTEAQTTRLARELHDDLGGLIVSAAMDFSSLTQHLLALDPPLHEQMRRIRTTIEAAIDLSRRMSEDLMPSILSNFGLFAALRWQLKRASGNSAALCSEVYPEIEPRLEAHALIGLFRVAQDALAMTFQRGSVTAAHLDVHIDGGKIRLTLTDDGVPVMIDGEERGAATALAAMRHRIRALGGEVKVERTEGRTTFAAWMPFEESIA